MLARVSDSYYGTFGLFHEETKSNEIMTRESAPFEVDDALFRRKEAEGILVRADSRSEQKKEAKPEPPKTEAADPEEDEDTPLEEKTLKELREIAKGYDITYRVGMTKADLVTAIQEAEGIEPPVMVAAEPE